MGAREEDLARSAFSFSQIGWILNNHKGPHLSRASVLSYDIVNYLPLLKPNGKVVFVAAQSCKDDFKKKHKKWYVWFKMSTEEYYWKAHFLLKETPITIE